ncbi:hypothetical protein Bca101_083555 [Brassica carinata]
MNRRLAYCSVLSLLLPWIRSSNNKSPLKTKAEMLMVGAGGKSPKTLALVLSVHLTTFKSLDSVRGFRRDFGIKMWRHKWL